jgi:hypothetical protein
VNSDRSTRRSSRSVYEAAGRRERRSRPRVGTPFGRKDFSDVSDHAGVLITTEELQPRELRGAVERVGRAYPSLDGVVEFLSDWC